MQRALELAQKGQSHVHPNPMVGAVIVCEGKIIGEGYHTQYGQPHAEVEAINAVKDKALLRKSTIYVNLEPCAHHGKTPPCAHLIVRMGITKVVISNLDPHDKVAGQGVRILEEAGIQVVTGVLKDEGERLNRSFFTYHACKRPHVVLKWAQTQDGYIGRPTGSVETKQISGPMANHFTHQLRAQSDAIFVGTRTALLDNPSLTTRLVDGPNPLRVTIDLQGQLPETHHLFTDGNKTLVFGPERPLNADFVALDDYSIQGMLDALYQRHVTQVLVEGGAQLLSQFLDTQLWDVCHVIQSKSAVWTAGIEAPQQPDLEPDQVQDMKHDVMTTYSQAPCFSF